MRFGVAAAFIAVGLSWLMLGEGSPLEDFFSDSAVSNWWGELNIIPAFVAMIASGNIHGGNVAVFYLCVFAQWFVVGVILAGLIQSLPGD